MALNRKWEFGRCRGLPGLFVWILVWALLLSGPAQAAGELVFEATAIYGRRIDLVWSAVPGAEGYRLARSCSEDAARGFCPLTSLPPQSLGYPDITVEEGKTYTYRLEAAVAGAARSAQASATTPPLASLPTAHPAVYPAPQGAWSLGDPIALASVRGLRIRYNGASREDLRILLDPGDAHSLVSRLGNAGYAVAFEPGGVRSIGRAEAEIYFHDFSQKPQISRLPAGVKPFDRMGDEGYVLVAEEVESQGFRIVVGANTPKGLFRGGMAVERLLIEIGTGRRRARLGPVVVLDYPDHPKRGAFPSWRPMTALRSSIPEKTLDMLDSLARSGANSVDWRDYWAAQEEYSWEKFGARAAALVQVEASRRFIDVNFFMGSSYVGHGSKGPPEVKDIELSLEQVPYGDGLGVLREPFFWVEEKTGQWQAASERQGVLLGRRTGSGGSPWLAAPCSGGGWRFGPEPTEFPGESSRGWQLSGPARDCELVQVLDAKGILSRGRYFLAGRLHASGSPAGLEASLTLEIEAGGTTRRFAVPLEMPAGGAGKAREFALVIPDLGTEAPVRKARLVVQASLSSGRLRLDDFELRAWDTELLVSGKFGRTASWEFGTGRGSLEIDDSRGRSDTKSLRAKLPLTLTPGNAAQIAQSYQPIRLEEGRYVLGAWVRAEKSSASEGSGGNGKVSVKGDINLYFFETPSAGPSQGKRKLASEFLRFPSPLDSGPGDWVYFAHVFDVSAELAKNARSARVQVRFFQSSVPGRVWVDDIELRRLDGDLRNLRGTVSPPVLETRSGERLVEGKDYEICQVGDRETLCSAPGNYKRMLEGGQGATYDSNLNPFVIRWLGKDPPRDKRILISYDLGAQYTSVASATRSWDGQKTVSTVLNFCDFAAVAKGIELEKVLGRYLDGYELENFPSWGETYRFKADFVTWGVSEVRGMNRSVACLDEDGKAKDSNAALFARVVNDVFAATMKKHPGAEFWLWADMFNPFSNGGDREYQVRYGGREGRSMCALGPRLLPALCSDEVDRVPLPILEHAQAGGGGIVMKPWSYPPFALRRMVAVAAWYQELGLRSQVLSGASPINVEDWAAIANSFSGIEGGVSTIFHASRYGGKSGLIPGLRAFWNHDWKILYLFDGENPSSSFYQIEWPFEPVVEMAGAKLDNGGRCGVASEKFVGNSDAGICLDASSGKSSVTLGEVRVTGGADYRVDVMARQKRRGRRHQSSTPLVTVSWPNGENTQVQKAELIYDSSGFPGPNRFDRYRVSFQAPESAATMILKFEFDASMDAADSIAIFESIDPCFEDCDTVVGASASEP